MNSEINVLIYSGGKTASSALNFSFCKILGNGVYHTHSNTYTSLFKKPIMTIKDIINQPRKQKLLIISVYREPISRHISALFEQYQSFLKNNFESNYVEKKIKSILVFGQQHYHPHTESQSLKDDIDIFQFPFNKKDGYQIYENDKFKWIYIRFDHMNEAQKIIRDHTQYKDIIIDKYYTSDAKPYAKIYEKFTNISLPRDLLDYCFERDKQSLNYFYSDIELQELKNKWYSHCTDEKTNFNIDENCQFVVNG